MDLSNRDSRDSDVIANGTRRHQIGHSAQAEGNDTETVRNDPDHADTHHRLGLSALQAGRTDVAIDRLRRAVGQNAGQPLYHFHLGSAYRLEHRPDDAVHCFQRALALRPGYGAAYLALCAALLEMARPDLARPMLEAIGCPLPVQYRLSEGRRRVVALTIDDGPTPETTPALLDVLARFGATASFFVTGSRAARHPDRLRSLIDAGHEVYAHGYRHQRFDSLTPDRIRDELEYTEALLTPLRPPPSPYPVRLPYGSGWADSRVHRAVQAWRPDVRLVQWSLSVDDWAIPDRNTTPEALSGACAAAARRLATAPRLDRSIVLLHDQPFDRPLPPGGIAAGVPILAGFLEALKRRNYLALSLGDAERIEQPNG